jgi:sugar phosphate isomerase/epimerase
MDAPARESLLANAKAHHVEIVSYGVINGKDEADWRQIFAFAKAMGMQNIAAEPPQEEFPLIARLATEYGIVVSIHDHAAPSRYANPDVALAAIGPYANFGLCADTGHWVRSGYDPVAALRKAQGRIISLHFKDLNQRGVREAHDVPWGTGVCDIAGQVLELRRQGFTGIVFAEYETISPARDDGVARSVAYYRRLIAASDDDIRAGRVVPDASTR